MPSKTAKKKPAAKKKTAAKKKRSEAKPLEAQKLPPFPKHFDLSIGAGRYRVDPKGMTGAHALAMAHLYRQLTVAGSSSYDTQSIMDYVNENGLNKYMTLIPDGQG